MAMDAEAALQKLRDEKLDHAKKIAEIEQQIDTWEGVLAGLRFLGNPESQMPLPRRMDLDGLGLQDAVLTVLRRSPVPLNPVEIREVLMASGMVGSSPKNLLISVHTVITRLGDRVEEVSGPDGKPAYKLRMPPPGPHTKELHAISKKYRDKK